MNIIEVMLAVVIIGLCTWELGRLHGLKMGANGAIDILTKYGYLISTDIIDFRGKEVHYFRFEDFVQGYMTKDQYTESIYRLIREHAERGFVEDRLGE